MNDFDLVRIFWGDTTLVLLAEIAFRTTVLFCFTLLMMRIVGHRGIGQLTVTELVIVIAFGSAVGDPMFYIDIPLIHGMLVIVLISLYQVLLTTVSMNWKSFARFEEGVAIRVVVDGMIDLHGLHKARLTREELLAELRQGGVRDLGEVQRAYLEIDGEVSVFRFDHEHHNQGLSTMPDAIKIAREVHENELVMADDTYSCDHCGYTTHLLKGTIMPKCPRCEYTHWISAPHPAKAHNLLAKSP